MSQIHANAVGDKNSSVEDGIQKQITDLQALAETIITFERYFNRNEEPAKVVLRVIGATLSRNPSRDTMIQIQAALRLTSAAIVRREEEEVARLCRPTALNLRQGN